MGGGPGPPCPATPHTYLSTSIFRPSTIVPFSFSRARSASELVSKVTNPKPCEQRRTDRRRQDEKREGEVGEGRREGERGGASRVSEGQPPVSEVCLGASTRRSHWGGGSGRGGPRQGQLVDPPEASPDSPSGTPPRETGQRDANLARGRACYCNPTLG